MNYSAMTINERLFVSNLDKDFYDAVDRKDEVRMIEILRQVDVSESNIDAILDQFGLERPRTKKDKS